MPSTPGQATANAFNRILSQPNHRSRSKTAKATRSLGSNSPRPGAKGRRPSEPELSESEEVMEEGMKKLRRLILVEGIPSKEVSSMKLYLYFLLCALGVV